MDVLLLMQLLHVSLQFEIPLLEASNVAPDQGNLISSRNCQQNQCKVSRSGCSFQETTPPTDTLTLNKPP